MVPGEKPGKKGKGMKMRRASLLLSACCLLIVMGCASSGRMYSGPALPADKTARLSFHEPVRIISVDGNNVPFVFGTLEVLPGSHTLSVMLHKCNYQSGLCESSEDTVAVPFEAAAGRSYSVQYSRKANAWNAWVEEDK